MYHEVSGQLQSSRPHFGVPVVERRDLDGLPGFPGNTYSVDDFLKRAFSLTTQIRAMWKHLLLGAVIAKSRYWLQREPDSRLTRRLPQEPEPWVRNS